MKSIAKKSKVVKVKKGHKPPQTPPRYTLKKDSLGRRYAIDKRTSRRVPVFKATKEREQRKKAKEAEKSFRGITPPRKQKAKLANAIREKRSEAARKGWDTRRKREALALPELELSEERIVEIGEQLGVFSIPRELRMRVLGGIADRADLYPNIKRAANDAFTKLRFDQLGREIAKIEGRPVPLPIPTPKFDRMFGIGLGQVVRDRLASCRDVQDVDQILDRMADDPEFQNIPARELYTLYFSPEVA
jgi:hypothetical protein